MITIKDNLLFVDGKQVEYIQTPNVSSGTILPKYVIEHFTADTNPSSTKSWFKNKDAKASSQILIDREGKITQFCKLNQKAWHAGVSKWNGIEGLNSFSIGIEMTNAGRLHKKGDFYYGTYEDVKFTEEQVIKAKHKNEKTESYWLKYTDIQLEVCLELTNLLVAHFNMDDVLGHDDIAPGRKSDPGPAFPIEKFKPSPKLGKIKTLKDNVNFRVGAGIEYKSIEVIPSGKAVTETLIQGDWSRIEYNNKLGWVNNKYLK